jgi:hypothetical protein
LKRAWRKRLLSFLVAIPSSIFSDLIQAFFSISIQKIAEICLILLVIILFGKSICIVDAGVLTRRLSFGPPMEELKRGLDGIERVLIKYGVHKK